MFKTRGFSSNNSLKRRAVIVDAPDLPPEECEFFITGQGVADSEGADIVEDDLLIEFESIELEESKSGDNAAEKGLPVDKITGIGKGIRENLNKANIFTVEQLIKSNFEELSEKIDVSIDRLKKWRDSGVALLDIS